MTTDLDVARQSRFVTSRYQSWKREHGVPVRITVGYPRFGQGPRLRDRRVMAPYGLMAKDLPTDERRERYRARLDDKGDEIVTALADLVIEHPGETLVLCASRTSMPGRSATGARHRGTRGGRLAPRGSLRSPANRVGPVVQ
jgi:hypothetical protein